MNFGLRWLAGALAAAVLAAAAWRAGSLSARGAVAAFVVGWLACAAGWEWAALLLAFFVTGSALSRLPSQREREVEEVVEKGAVRDPFQVFANGGVFALAAVGALLNPSAIWPLAAAGALAAATADTWATEIGTRFGGTPRTILTGRAVRRGTSGAVSATGLLASAAGAALIATLAQALGIAGFAAVLIAGVGGALADSLLGATVQERRMCHACGTMTERRLHPCGTESRHAGGIAGVNNDVVNLLATAIGALIALVWWSRP